MQQLPRDAEIALRESESRLRAIFAAIDEGYCLCAIVLNGAGHATDYVFLEVNPLFETMTGLKDPVGKSALQLVPDLERHWIDTYAKVAVGGETLRFESGSAAMGRLFDVFATPVPPAGRFAVVFRDITARKEAEERQALLVKELNHRVKNSLATIQAIASQTLRSASNLEEFGAVFNGRLGAIARAHDSLFESGEGRAGLANLIRKQVGPYSGTSAKRLKLHGKPLWLTAEQAHALGLILHELATNAAKYGALSGDDGSITVRWSMDETGAGPRIAVVDWVERGGPVVTAPGAKGFGSRLIESTLSHSLGGDATLSFERAGLSARLRFPLEVAS